MNRHFLIILQRDDISNVCCKNSLQEEQKKMVKSTHANNVIC